MSTTTHTSPQITTHTSTMKKMMKLNSEFRKTVIPSPFGMYRGNRPAFNTGTKFAKGDLVKVGASYSFLYAVVIDTCDKYDFDGKTQVEYASWNYEDNRRYAGGEIWIHDYDLLKIE